MSDPSFDLIRGYSYALGGDNSFLFDTLTLLSISLFYFLCYVIVTSLRPSVITNDSKKILPYDNTVVSLIHSIISSYLVGCCFLANYPTLIDDLLHFPSNLHSFTVANTTAYMFYDLLTFVYYPRDLSMFLHHTVIIICFGVSFYLHDYCTVLVFSLMAEVNSLFLHMRKTLQLLNRSNSLLYNLSLLGLSTTYFPIRVLPHFYLVWYLLNPSNVFPHLYQFYVGTLGMIGICVIDLFFFFRFLNTDIFSLFGLYLSKTKKTA